MASADLSPELCGAWFLGSVYRREDRRLIQGGGKATGGCVSLDFWLSKKLFLQHIN